MVQLNEALRYNQEGRDFDSRWCNWKCLSRNRSGRAKAMGLTEPVTDISKVKVKVIPQQAEVAQGVPGRLRPRIYHEYFLGAKAAGV